MNKREAGQYLDTLFGQREGYIAAAYKDRDESWQEKQFAWPKDRTTLLGWAAVHADANIFVCPALRRDAHTRKKGDMLPTSWLWADVDMQNIPQDKRTEVEARIAEVGTVVVSSGSGDNRHVYVNLGTPVDHTEHIRLNTGLKDFLRADAKQADNSLLRLPGTTNWKTDTGTGVKLEGGTGRAVSKASLLKRRVFRDVKVMDDWEASEWDFVEPEGLPRRVRALVEMAVEEAEARYGSRYKAVWAVTGDLHRKGYDTDTIHTLMHRFPPALSKAASENGYDVHRDVDKRLMWDRSKAIAAEDTEADEDAGDVFEELSVEEFEDSTVREQGERILLRRKAERWARQQEALGGHTEPPPDMSESLSDALRAPAAPVQYLIDGLCSAAGNVVIAGQYKSGKTKLMMASLVTSLVDNEPFLGAYEVHVPDGGAVVGHWNLEMSRLDLVDKYMRPAGVKNPHNIHLAHWRGVKFSILTEPGQEAAVEWLRSRNVKVWTIDSWTALCRMCGVDPNSGVEVGALLGAIDEIKQAAGVDVLFFLAHTARASSESERPGTRGASEVDDHVDSRWMVTVDKSGVRFLQAEGRDTQMPAMSLDFDEDTGRSKLGSTTRAGAARDGVVQLIVKAVQNHGRPVARATLVKLMRENKVSVRQCDAGIEEAVESGFIEVEVVPRPGGGRSFKQYTLTRETAPEDDRTRRATPREVNLANVRVKRNG